MEDKAFELIEKLYIEFTGFRKGQERFDGVDQRFDGIDRKLTIDQKSAKAASCLAAIAL